LNVGNEASASSEMKIRWFPVFGGAIFALLLWSILRGFVFEDSTKNNGSLGMLSDSEMSSLEIETRMIDQALEFEENVPPSNFSLKLGTKKNRIRIRNPTSSPIWLRGGMSLQCLA
jgi:hypothetical protein